MEYETPQPYIAWSTHISLMDVQHRQLTLALYCALAAGLLLGTVIGLVLQSHYGVL